MKKNDYSALSPDAARAFDDAISQFGEKTFTWLAGLWEPEIGGFYYSNSSRDNEYVSADSGTYRLLPDVESTVQILRFLDASGMFKHVGGTWKKSLPDLWH